MSERLPKQAQSPLPQEEQPLHDAHVKKFNEVAHEKAHEEAQTRLRNNPERVRGIRHVQTVQNSIYSQNRDVAERMEKMLVEGHDLMQIVDDLRSQSASRSITITPEYRQVADRAAAELVRLENAEFDKKPKSRP